MRRHVIVLLILVIVLAVEGFAYFGKNKVKGSPYNWREYQAEQFTLYYYESAEDIARYAIPVIESAIAEYSSFFDIEFSLKIPIIIYHSPYDFQETTLLPYVLPEGVGGFTEYIKGRVVVPFNGSYIDFKHVIRHELIHEFILLKSQVLWDIDDLSFDAEFPLWVHEGLAEYLSIDVTHSDNVFMRTLMLSGGFVPLERIWTINGTYQMYKQGQFFWKYMTDTFGDDIIKVFFKRAAQYKSFIETLERLTGLTFAQISYEFEMWLKNKFLFTGGDLYKSVFTDAEPMDVKAIQYWPLRDGGVYVAAETGYIDIIRRASDGKKKKLLRIGTSGGYEYISLQRLPITVENGFVYCAVKSGVSDRLIVIDIKTGKIVKKHDFRGKISLINSIAPFGEELFIQAVSAKGLQGIYKISSDGSLQLLFETPFSIGKIALLKNELVFSQETGNDGFHQLYSIDINTLQILQLTSTEGHNYNPFFTADGLLYYLSDRSGITDVYVFRNENESEKLTSTAHYIFKAWASGQDVYFSTHTKSGYQIFRLMTKKGQSISNTTHSEPSFDPPQLEYSSFESKNAQYVPRFSFDFAQADFSSSPRYGYTGGATFLLSDMLNEHEIWLQMGFSDESSSLSSLLEKSNIVSMYVNKKNRYYYYAAAFHLYRPFSYRDLDDFDVYDERVYGVSGGVIFPFDRFSRISAGFSYGQRERNYFFEDEITTTGYSAFSFEYSFDNTLWNRVGPLDGWRYAIGTDFTFKTDSEFSYMNSYYIIDVRRYFRVFKNTCFAVRGSYAISEGVDNEKELLATGGSLSLRGYRYYELRGYKQLLFNMEYRFPIFPYIIFVTTGGEIVFPGIHASLFFDAGNCWSNDADNKLKGSYGWALQMGLGPTVLRLDFAKKTDFNSIDSGFETKFAMGWNF